MTRKWANVFRISADLNDEIDPEILARAVPDLKKRFPTFFTRLRTRMFWPEGIGEWQSVKPPGTGEAGPGTTGGLRLPIGAHESRGAEEKLPARPLL